jgi:tetratricopeptide (TPR) repeat protein
LIGVLVVSMIVLAGGANAQPDDLAGPPPEVAARAANVDPPAIPGFELPAAEPGLHTPRELRVRGKPLLGTEIKVVGHVTWIYDCAAVLAAANPRAKRAQILAAIDADPARCERPRFFLGDARDAARDASIWVADVPRAPGKPERARLSKAELKARPAVPKIALGDRVVVTGTWAIQSPGGEHNPDGLLVYGGLERAAPAAASAAAAPVAAPAEPEIAVVTRPPARPPVDGKVRGASLGHLGACNKAIVARQYDAAIAECTAATRAWDGNHLAWYTGASAHMAKGEWARATAAVERAVALRPDLGMYQLYHGVALYEAEHQRAREDQARKDGKKPDEIAVDPSQLRLDAARDALRRAVKLAPDLWRAHYYLGRLYLDVDDGRRAAEQLTLTIKTHPAYRFGYLALSELYRRWGYSDAALAVALLGTAHVPAAEVGELWFEAGMAHAAKQAEGKAGDPASEQAAGQAIDKAIAAFGKAIAAKPDDAASKFQRGQLHLRKGDLASARADLEDVIASGDPRLARVKPIARQLLAQIAGKQR